jgi:hypothetical protein
MNASRSRSARVLALATLLVATAAACGGGDGPTPPVDPGPQLTINGTYTLKLINGAPPPVNVDPGNACTARIVGNGVLAFSDVHEVSIRWEVDPGCGGTSLVVNQSGQYRTVNGALVLDSSPEDTIRVSGDTARLVTHRTRPIALMVFTR